MKEAEIKLDVIYTNGKGRFRKAVAWRSPHQLDYKIYEKKGKHFEEQYIGQMPRTYSVYVNSFAKWAKAVAV